MQWKRYTHAVLFCIMYKITINVKQAKKIHQFQFFAHYKCHIKFIYANTMRLTINSICNFFCNRPENRWVEKDVESSTYFLRYFLEYEEVLALAFFESKLVKWLGILTCHCFCGIQLYKKVYILLFRFNQTLHT